MTDTNQVATYPSDEQMERWQSRREELGFRSRSAFVEAMIEAGLKKFDSPTSTDADKVRLLREQRNDLRDELERARERIQELEEALYRDEQQEILEYIDTNPGASYEEIVQHVINTVPGRVTEHLEELEGRKLRQTGDGYHLATDGLEGSH
jgi:hypothetical protein